MQGKIGFRSTPEKGATFWISFTAEKALVTEKPTIAKPFTAPADMRILVGAPNQALRHHIAALLQSWKIEVMQAANTEEIMAGLSESVYSQAPLRALLIDLTISGGAASVAEQIKSNPDYRDTALIVMVFLHDRKKTQDLTKKYFAGYLTKPLKPAAIQQYIESLTT